MTKKDNEIVRTDRRSFLSFLPLGILAGIFVSLGAAAKRSLGPQGLGTEETGWQTISDLAGIAGEEPIEKTIALSCRSGWSKTVEQISVFVLPKYDNKVVSSVCPHEGCPIVWESASTSFLCPCHDSYFGDDGRRRTGPAVKDLTEFETRVEDGKLQIRT